jgi:tripartite-type tricarboxylate transporter receptor subunit TctC
MRRRNLIATGLAFAGAATGARAQERFPDRPLRLVIGFSPGGPTDIVGRRFAEMLGAKLGQSVVVENRSGASGSVGAIEVARARPDGYTLLLTTPSAHAIFPQIAVRPGYDPLADFSPIGLVTIAPVVFAAHPSFPARDLPAMMDLVRARPGAFSFGSGGAGTITHFGMELFMSRAGGLQMVHVPYRGAGPAVQDCVAGHIPLVVDTFAPMIEHHRAGRLRILAVLAEQRSAVAPDVPTAVEHGVPGAIANTYNALLGPAGMAEASVATLGHATRQATENDEFRAFLRAISAEPVSGMTPDRTAAYIRGEYAKWTPIIQASGLRIE